MRRFYEGPKTVHPEKPGAVGSRDSLNRNARNEYAESKLLIDEEVDKVLNHISSKLPPEVLSKLHVGATIKELIHNYYNQGFHNMLNRYLTTAEDELAKKVRTLVDKEEHISLNKYTPRVIGKLIDSVGGLERFNTTEIEKSIVNVYGHLEGHIQRGTYELEQDTNSLLRQKVDVGAFIRGENTYSVLKCIFKDSVDKPLTVNEIGLSINVLSSNLISPVYHYQVLSDVIIKEVLSDHIHQMIDDEIKNINFSQMDTTGGAERTLEEVFFNKFELLDGHLDKENTEDRFGKFLADIDGLLNKIKDVDINEKIDFDILSIKNSALKLIEDGHYKNQGYNRAVNSITSILDTSKMGYQYINNYKNARRVVIREYEEIEPSDLPDEKYTIVVEYLDQEQLRETRISYIQQFHDFEYEIEKIWNLYEEIYKDIKQKRRSIDYQDVHEKYNKSNKFDFWGLWKTRNTTEDDDENGDVWDEITFIEPDDTEVEKIATTFKSAVNKINKKIYLLRVNLDILYERHYPEERILIEDRITFIEKKFTEFTLRYNPFHCQTGVVLNVSLSTIKRKKTTMKSMSNVLNEFLYSISKGFKDDAFADFSRRRSTDTLERQEEQILQDVTKGKRLVKLANDTEETFKI